MSIAITWNGGKNAIMLSPSVKVWAIILGIFTIGVVCVGLAALALIAGVGYLIYSIALLVLHVLSAAIYSSLFSFAFSLFLCAGLLVLFVMLCLRVFTPLARGMRA